MSDHIIREYSHELAREDSHHHAHVEDSHHHHRTEESHHHHRTEESHHHHRSRMEASTTTDLVYDDEMSAVYLPTPDDFEEYFGYASQLLMSPLNYTFRIFKRRRLSKRSNLSKLGTKFKEGSLTIGSVDLDNERALITISTFYDNADNLVHLKFEQDVLVPREVLKIIAFMVPFHRHLAKITFNGGMAAYTAHEIKTFQRKLHDLTEICLDNSFVPEANFAILLDAPTQVKHLSLARCKINDEVVRRIFEKLLLEPAASTLNILNLAGNRITDEGAMFIAKVLRKNRSLYYLNLSANKQLTDDGIISILDTMKMFPLTPEELLLKKQEHFQFLEDNTIGFSELCLTKSEIKIRQKEGVYDPIDKAQFIELLENKPPHEFKHSFSKNHTVLIGNITYCLGNNILSCLILSHCNLGLLTLRKLIQVMEYQKGSGMKPRGLVHLNIEGTAMPTFCHELYALEELLDDQLMMTIHDKKTVTIKSPKDTGKPKSPLSRGKSVMMKSKLNMSNIN